MVKTHKMCNKINNANKIQTFQKKQPSNLPAGPESKIVRLAGERFRVCLQKSAFFKWTKAALVNKTLVCSLFWCRKKYVSIVILYGSIAISTSTNMIWLTSATKTNSTLSYQESGLRGSCLITLLDLSILDHRRKLSRVLAV